jgi:diaminopimelate decarboxylase
MGQFSYRNGDLFAENVDVADIADQVGTPFYISTVRPHL